MVLRELGYRVDPARSAADHVTYWRGEGGVQIIVLPVYSPRDRVWPHHLDKLRIAVKYDHPEDLDRYEVLIRTHPRTWAVTAANMTEPFDPEVGHGPSKAHGPAANGTANGRRKPARRAKAKKAPPAA
jgi:hypothetical protein